MGLLTTPSGVKPWHWQGLLFLFSFQERPRDATLVLNLWEINKVESPWSTYWSTILTRVQMGSLPLRTHSFQPWRWRSLTSPMVLLQKLSPRRKICVSQKTGTRKACVPRGRQSACPVCIDHLVDYGPNCRGLILMSYDSTQHKQTMMYKDVLPRALFSLLLLWLEYVQKTEF